MAVFTAIALVKSLSPERRDALGLPADAPAPKIGPGPRRVLTTEVKRRLAGVIARRQRDIDDGTVRFEHGYGDKCSDVAAIRSFALDEYRRRLIREGNEPVEADRLVEEYARTPEFRKHMKSHKVALSRVRRSEHT